MKQRPKGDGSARPQSVRKRVLDFYHCLIEFVVKVSTKPEAIQHMGSEENISRPLPHGSIR